MASGELDVSEDRIPNVMNPSVFTCKIFNFNMSIVMPQFPVYVKAVGNLLSGLEAETNRI